MFRNVIYIVFKNNRILVMLVFFERLKSHTFCAKKLTIRRIIWYSTSVLCVCALFKKENKIRIVPLAFDLNFLRDSKKFVTRFTNALREIRMLPCLVFFHLLLRLLFQCTKGCEAWQQALDTSCQAVCVSIVLIFIFKRIIGQTYIYVKSTVCTMLVT